MANCLENFTKSLEVNEYQYSMNPLVTRFKNFLYFGTDIRIFSVTKDTVSNYQSSIDFELIKISDSSEIYECSDSNIIKNNILKFKYFLERGCGLFFAMYENKVIGHFITSEIARFRPYPYLKTSLFEGHNFYIFFCRTDNNYRGQGVYPEALARIVQEDPFPKQYFISTETNNTSSIKGITKAGFSRRADLRFKSIFGITFSEEFR